MIFYEKYIFYFNVSTAYQNKRNQIEKKNRIQGAFNNLQLFNKYN